MLVGCPESSVGPAEESQPSSKIPLQWGGKCDVSQLSKEFRSVNRPRSARGPTGELTIYESKAEEEVSWYQEQPTASLTLIRSTGLGPGARLVDVGGGASLLVDHLIDEGWRNITVLDIA